MQIDTIAYCSESARARPHIEKLALYQELAKFIQYHLPIPLFLYTGTFPWSHERFGSFMVGCGLWAVGVHFYFRKSSSSSHLFTRTSTRKKNAFCIDVRVRCGARDSLCTCPFGRISQTHDLYFTFTLIRALDCYVPLPSWRDSFKQY